MNTKAWAPVFRTRHSANLTFFSRRTRLLVPLPMRSVALALLLTLPITGARAAESSDPLKDAPPTYREALIAAMRSFTARDFEKARETVQKADSSWQQTPVSLNILGAIEIEQRNFDEG